MTTSKRKQGDWDFIDSRANNPEEHASELTPKSVTDLSATRLPDFPAEVAPVGGPIQRFTARRQAGREVLEAQLKRLRMIVDASLKIDKARIDVRVEHVMAELREERLAFLAHLGVRELERMRELARKMERLFTEWFREVQEKDMPAFMSNRIIEELIQRWGREMNKIFKIEG